MKAYMFCAKCREQRWFKFLGIDTVKGRIVNVWRCETCSLTYGTFERRKK